MFIIKKIIGLEWHLGVVSDTVRENTTQQFK